MDFVYSFHRRVVSKIVEFLRKNSEPLISSVAIKVDIFGNVPSM